MRRLAVAALLVRWLFAAPAPARLSAQAVSSFDRLYSSYASGDYAVIQRIDPHARRLHERPTRTSSAPSGGGKATGSACTSRFCSTCRRSRCRTRWLTPIDPSVGRRGTFVRGRPTRVGANAEDDRFEAMYHKAAVALLLAASYPDAADAYLDSLRDRVVAESSR